jgi:hypothetical protein
LRRLLIFSIETPGVVRRRYAGVRYTWRRTSGMFRERQSKSRGEGGQIVPRREDSSPGRKQPEELLELHLGVADQLAEQAGLQCPMVRDCERLVTGVRAVTKPKVTPTLANDFVAETLEGSDGLLTRNRREFRAHGITTTLPTKTPDGSGISSFRAWRSSRHNSIASLILASASPTVSPWL